ncbi:hypothetical protein F503_04864 [Ophiostoma piceae UAMH 11346]|uniref:Uncharacterized protein n=1 Tax=Ophiostoma piceae (strain UAMH 11346) TaxID=1262450 RepID=S3BX22_OPHP1|nr:hypothetical protein F503_04864 [Ophiostoma piceae UAMH 11346]
MGHYEYTHSYGHGHRHRHGGHHRHSRHNRHKSHSNHNSAVDNWNAFFKDYSSEYKDGFYVGPPKKSLICRFFSCIFGSSSSKKNKHRKRRR